MLRYVTLSSNAAAGVWRAASRLAADHAYDEKHDGEHGEGYERGEHGRLYARIVLCAEQARNEHRAAGVRTQSYSHEDIYYRIGCAYRGERRLSGEFARDYGIGKGIQLLEYRAAEQRKNIYKQYFERLADRKVCILHKKYPHKNVHEFFGRDDAKNKTATMPAVFFGYELYHRRMHK